MENVSSSWILRELDRKHSTQPAGESLHPKMDYGVDNMAFMDDPAENFDHQENGIFVVELNSDTPEGEIKGSECYDNDRVSSATDVDLDLDQKTNMGDSDSDRQDHTTAFSLSQTKVDNQPNMETGHEVILRIPDSAVNVTLDKTRDNPDSAVNVTLDKTKDNPDSDVSVTLEKTRDSEAKSTENCTRSVKASDTIGRVGEPDATTHLRDQPPPSNPVQPALSQPCNARNDSNVSCVQKSEKNSTTLADSTLLKTPPANLDSTNHLAVRLGDRDLNQEPFSTQAQDAISRSKENTTNTFSRTVRSGSNRPKLSLTDINYTLDSNPFDPKLLKQLFNKKQGGN